MKNIFKRQSLIILVFSISIILFGCSSDSKNESTDSVDVNKIVIDSIFKRKELLTVNDTIEAELSEAMERVRYRDNSGLYENEFAYVTEATDFDEYLTFSQISYQPPGSVIALKLDSLTMFDHDSASTWITISLEFQDGKVEEMTEQNLIVYYHKGRWIKPTIAVIKNQVEYDELIKQAEEASQWENE